MTQLSRRTFLALTGGLAAAWGLPLNTVARALDAPVNPADVQTTLVSTIRKAPGGGYVKLVASPGEPFLTRVDLLGKDAAPGRAQSRRSLLYMGHMSDVHVIDAQSPARLDTMAGVDPVLFSGNFRPHELLQVQILTGLVQALNGAGSSAVTGAPMAFVINTGDNADQRSTQELRWYINVLDGGKITANTGRPGEYEGVQVWPESNFAYHPEDPSNDMWGQQHGYPAIPGMIKAAISNPVDSPGLAVPWYSVYGNHDANYFGGWPTGWITNDVALGSRKAAVPAATERIFGAGMGTTSPFEQLFVGSLSDIGFAPGTRDVTPDPNRKLMSIMDYVKEHLDSPAKPGPVGHGFTQADYDNEITYWAKDVTPFVTLIGLNTCNITVGAGGSIPQDQFDWLKGQLQQAKAAKKLVIITSHHTSFTMDNVAQPVIGPQQNLVQVDEFISLLHAFPNVIAWMNGHTHMNRITAHANPDAKGGFWEISSSSCVDYAQQGRVTEIVDNRDGTLSIFTTVLDHDAPATANYKDLSLAGLGAISRELAANDVYWEPDQKLGSPVDRNCELLLPAPFDLSAITDQSLQQVQAAQRVRLLAAGKEA